MDVLVTLMIAGIIIIGMGWHLQNRLNIIKKVKATTPLLNPINYRDAVKYVKVSGVCTMVINGKTYAGTNLTAKGGKIGTGKSQEDYEEIYSNDNTFTITVIGNGIIKTNGNVILDGTCSEVITTRDVYLNGTSNNINTPNEVKFGNKEINANKEPIFNVKIIGNPLTIHTQGDVIINGNCSTINTAGNVLIDNAYSHNNIVVNGINKKNK